MNEVCTHMYLGMHMMYLTCDQAFFFGGEHKSVAALGLGVGRGRRTERLIQLLHKSPAASPESGLLSNWSKNRRL